MVWVIVGMYVLAAVLPTWGLLGVVREYSPRAVRAADAAAKERDTDDFEEWAANWGNEVIETARASAWRDLVLIGLGLALGAGASIWSLFLP